MPAVQTYITSITVAEILYGLDIMPQGSRKKNLLSAFSELLEVDFAGRILEFDTAAAVECAAIAGTRQRLGRPISFADAQIAAICRRHEAELLTRNIRDFDSTGIQVRNPFND